VGTERGAEPFALGYCNRRTITGTGQNCHEEARGVVTVWLEGRQGHKTRVHWLGVGFCYFGNICVVLSGALSGLYGLA